MQLKHGSLKYRGRHRVLAFDHPFSEKGERTAIMTITVQCPQCNRQLRTRDEMTGRRLKCPGCRVSITVPEPSVILESHAEDAASPVVPPAIRRPMLSASQLHAVPAPSGVVRGTEFTASVDTPRTNTPQSRTNESVTIAHASATSEEPASDRLQLTWHKASVMIRALGYLIDLLPTFLAIPFFLIPILGQIVAGAILCAYWLLRDINGASLGKLALGCRVATDSGGQEATPKDRIFRNLPLAIIPLSLTIPFVGFFLVLLVGPVVIVAELMCLLTKGRRVGDILAGTTVVFNRDT